ncbi:uncharacterized protein LOC134760304 isoform X1 [Pongo abelii]|uniref:uncharacterized protein LOC134760304 isoform X1 n=1 Tax=Pongo abelii TaxID=9601 RepID=UPI0030048BFF
MAFFFPEKSFLRCDFGYCSEEELTPGQPLPVCVDICSFLRDKILQVSFHFIIPRASKPSGNAQTHQPPVMEASGLRHRVLPRCQAGLQLLDSNQSASASQSAGITDTSHGTGPKPIRIFSGQTGKCNQDENECQSLCITVLAQAGVSITWHLGFLKLGAHGNWRRKFPPSKVVQAPRKTWGCQDKESRWVVLVKKQGPWVNFRRVRYQDV